MAGPPDRTAAAGRPAALLMRVLGARLRYQATRKGGTNKVSDLQQHELFTAQAKEALDEGADRVNWHQVGTMIQGFPIANRKARRATWPDGKRRACPRRCGQHDVAGVAHPRGGCAALIGAGPLGLARQRRDGRAQLLQRSA
jgi:hypothetical protein